MHEVALQPNTAGPRAWPGDDLLNHTVGVGERVLGVVVFFRLGKDLTDLDVLDGVSRLSRVRRTTPRSTVSTASASLLSKNSLLSAMIRSYPQIPNSHEPTVRLFTPIEHAANKVDRRIVAIDHLANDRTHKHEHRDDDRVPQANHQ